MWQPQSILEPRLGGELFAVDCAGASMCIAVGNADQTGSGGLHFSRSLAYRYNGTSWNSSYPPDPADAIFGQLTSIACPTPAFCVAPSTYTNGGDENQAFADVWRSGAWQTTPLPLPASSIASGDSGISSTDCPSASECVAVGNWSGSTFSEHALVESWDGSSWHRRRAPLPMPSDGAPGSAVLAGVSCGSATVCIGTGSYLTTSAARRVLALERQSLG